MDFLLRMVKALFHIDMKHNPVHNGKRMASAIAVMCSLKKTGTGLDLNDVSALLYMLLPMPDIQSQKCVDWECVRELIPKGFEHTAFASVKVLACSLSEKRYFTQPEWLYAMPVMHFLSGASIPFQEKIFTPTDIPWGSKLIDLSKVRSHTTKEFG